MEQSPTQADATPFINASARRRAEAYAIVSPVLVHSRADIAGLLRGHRMAIGMTCEQLDAHAGFSDRYTAKLEHGDKPQGRQGFQIHPPANPDDAGRIAASYMAEVWLEALGLQLVLMPADQAEAIGAKPAPVRVVREAA